MPNHVATRLTITGPIADINKFIAAAKGEVLLDFNQLHPMPKSLESTISPVCIITEEQRQQGKMGLLESESKSLIQQFGTDNWYDWKCKQWGTKWGAYHVGSWQVDAEAGTAHITYDTAWSPAAQFYQHVSGNWPTLTFKHEYADEGGFFVGHQSIANGEIIDDVGLEWNSPDGIALRTGLGYGDDEEEEEEGEE